VYTSYLTDTDAADIAVQVVCSRPVTYHSIIQTTRTVDMSYDHLSQVPLLPGIEAVRRQGTTAAKPKDLVYITD
jgi:hypothetical protein